MKSKREETKQSTHLMRLFENDSFESEFATYKTII